jgi:hypothetical protein
LAWFKNKTCFHTMSQCCKLSWKLYANFDNLQIKICKF